MNEWLKYLSPVAILGIIWAIVQFYQKRKYEKKDFRRSEILEIFKYLHSCTNAINYGIIYFVSEFQNSYGLLEKDFGEFRGHEDQINEKFALVEKTINAIQDNEKKSLAEIDNVKLKLDILIDEIESLKQKGKSDVNKFAELTKKPLESILGILEKEVEKLNNITMLGISTNKKLKNIIFEITQKTNEVIRSVKLNTHLNKFGYVSKEFYFLLFEILQMNQDMEELMSEEIK